VLIVKLIEPPYTEPYVRGCERSGECIEFSLLLDFYLVNRNFIKNCDENRIKLFLKDDPMFVDRTLPYATAF
jgi:hypothetical protein